MHLMNFIGLIQYLTPAILQVVLTASMRRFLRETQYRGKPLRKGKGNRVFITFCDGLRRKVSQAVLNE